MITKMDCLVRGMDRKLLLGRRFRGSDGRESSGVVAVGSRSSSMVI